MSKKRRKIKEDEDVRTIWLTDLTDEEMERLRRFAELIDLRRETDGLSDRELAERYHPVGPEMVYEAGRRFEDAAHKGEWKEPKPSKKPRKHLKEGEDAVNPDHYKSGLGVECSELMKDRLGEDCYFGFCLCNAFKYLFRCRRKNPTLSEDVRKANWYLSSAVSLIDKEESHAR